MARTKKTPTKKPRKTKKGSKKMIRGKDRTIDMEPNRRPHRYRPGPRMFPYIRKRTTLYIYLFT